MGEKMVNGLGGMRMDRRDLKELTRMEIKYLKNVGMKKEKILNVPEDDTW